MILTSPDQLQSRPQRIISLVPSQTELLHYLGLEKETVGLTRFCIHPDQWHKSKVRIGGTKMVEVEKLLALMPDLIIANKEENIREQVEKLAERIPVWVTDVNDLPDAYQMILDIGKLTGKFHEAARLKELLQNEFRQLALSGITGKLIPSAYLIWKNPYMVAGSGTFIHHMMEKAGMKNIFHDQMRYPQVTIDQLKALNCELVLLSSEPYPFRDKDLKELEKELPGKKILLVNGEMFSWYGSRLLFAPGYFRQLRQIYTAPVTN